MNVQCPNCQKLLKAAERPSDRNVRCPKCGSTFVVRGHQKSESLSAIEQSEVRADHSLIPIATNGESENSNGSIPWPDQRQAHASVEDQSANHPSSTGQPQPATQANERSNLLYDGVMFKVCWDGTIDSLVSSKADAIQAKKEVALAKKEINLALRELRERQRAANSQFTSNRRAIGPSLYRYSRKGPVGVIYALQLIGHAINANTNVCKTNEVESIRAPLERLKLSVEKFELQLERFLLLG